MQRLVPSNHLMLASAKRVKALILEEIALDNIGEGTLFVGVYLNKLRTGRIHLLSLTSNFV